MNCEVCFGRICLAIKHSPSYMVLMSINHVMNNFKSFCIFFISIFFFLSLLPCICKSLNTNVRAVSSNQSQQNNYYNSY
ncbi:hypothetical protein QVD17_01174 [Tagetes erecta]|uniref:Uncharacterized protein n=1 Tax=Tagetes erecta TaxID=13708 RepID=A0AAD8LA48_TARER|nr:hypothetical protein QVD17_01174 [Tagetes erecta]